MQSLRFSAPVLSAEATVSAPFIASATQVFTPTVRYANQIDAPFIAAATTVNTPSLLFANSIDAPFIASGTTVNTPTLQFALQIAAPFISSGTVVRTPTLVGASVIMAPFIGAKATLTTALTGANNDLAFTAVRGGTEGNSITVAYVNGGSSQPLTVEVSNGVVTVYLATNSSGVITSTAAQVKAAIEASVPASYWITVAHAPANDGTGVVTALSATALSGGNGTSGGGVFTASRYFAPWGTGAGPSSTPSSGSTVAHAIYEMQLCDRFEAHVADLTTITFAKKGEYRLNRPTIWTGRVPARSTVVKGTHSDGRPKLCSGYRVLKVRRNGRLIFHGYVLRVDRVADENEAWATFTAIDPMHWLHFRPVRDESGNFSDPNYVSPIAGGAIVRRMLANTLIYEGEVGLRQGTFDETIPPAIDLAMRLGTWPVTMGEMATLLTESGVCDLGITPTEGGEPFVMGQLSARNRIGSDKSGSVHLDFSQGDNSITKVRYSDDFSDPCNKLWYFLGIRRDPEHWPANVTADDPDLLDPPQSAIESLIAQSRAALGVFMQIRYHDWGSRSVPDPDTGERRLARKLWQTEAKLKQKPRELIHVTPSPAAPYRPFDNYEPGDDIALNIDEEGLGIDVSGTQRVYGFDLMPDTEGVERVGELLTLVD